MSRRQKLSQLLALDFRAPEIAQWLDGSTAPKSPRFNARSTHDVDGVGAVLGGSDAFFKLETASLGEILSRVQADAKRHPLQIPVLAGADAVHGNALIRDGTIFPHNIGMGGAADSEIVREAARVTAVELRAQGVHWAFAPTLAVAQDVRWGRTYESYALETSLVSQLGAEAIRGFQDSQDTPVAACAKHMAADGATEGGIDRGNAIVTGEELLQTHLPPYRAAVEAGVMTVMASYSSINGLKCHENHWLLTDYLKGHLGFEGFVVSDWAALDCLSGVGDAQLINAINAGVDSFMVPGHYGRDVERMFMKPLLQAVEDGAVSEERLDDAARRVLRVKHRLGLFESNEPRADLLSKVGSPEHREVARRAVHASAVLLLNDNAILPLRPEASVTIACSGADNMGPLLGGFAYGWQGRSYSFPKNGPHRGTTMLEGLRRAPRGRSPGAVLHSPGGDLAEQTDVAIAVVSEPPYAEMRGDFTAAQSSPELWQRATDKIVPMGFKQTDPRGDALYRQADRLVRVP